MRICAVSYMNTKPFLEGIAHTFGADQPEVLTRVPSACAEAFAQEQCDIALVPAASLLMLENPTILPNYCIGADGQVDSVFLFSQVPIEQVEALNLDAHSMTSNRLARILLNEYWHRPVQLQHDDWETAIAGTTAAVVIGDKAIAAKARYPYVYDLAEAWKAHTGLPFVFAVWVAHASVSTEVLAKLDQAFAHGMDHLQQVAEKWGPQFGITAAQALQYFTHRIDYRFDPKKQEALNLYLDKARALAELV